MKKTIILSLSFLVSCFVLNSCDPWEDDSYHEGGNGNGMLLKEVHTVNEEYEGLTTYAYNSEGRVTEIKVVGNILDQQTYTLATYQYPTENKLITNVKVYMMGTLFLDTTTTLEITSDTAATMVMEDSMFGTVTSEIIYSAPCGISSSVNNSDIGGTSTTTYTYFDSNCSYREYIDDNLEETVYRDGKNAPYFDPAALTMGLNNPGNITKTESSDGTIHNITYQYNELDYPISASHTYTGGSGEADYTETFVYY